ncbi:chain-length determining protein [uncultured Brevundimonas sp.]|uniref:chain-length determining protein n=1 Tax=uncultured Brevundimonas sp. TaxID=213418 RepID=UPI0025E1E21C|nr:chain-length determining protein [uncultured Brevundimonas sp.]
MSNRTSGSTNPSVTYLGNGGADHPSRRRDLLKRIPVGFVLIVAIPTLVAAIYFLLFARPIFVSEAKFVVRSQNDRTPNALGVALQSVGLSTSSSDAFMVHAYIKSRNAVTDVSRAVSLVELVPNSSSMPKEDLYKALQKRITVGYDSTNGISTLRVRAYDAEAARASADALLDSGEKVINHLNMRSNAKAVREALQTLSLAEIESAKARSAIANFRSANRTVDPGRIATETSQVIGALMTALAEARAERAQVASQAPESPQLASLDAKVSAIESQISIERDKVVNGPDALTPQINAYEELVLNREISEKALIAARASYEEARADSRRQRLYLERVVEPNLPDKAILPRRALSVLLTFLTCLMLYGIGGLIWAGVREHRQV